jgi:daunorubicin resistance ABC transporter membrane protein
MSAGADASAGAPATRAAQPAATVPASVAPGVIAALVGRDLRRFFRQPSRVVGSIAQPLILWVVLGAGLGASFQIAGAGGVSYLQYFYPGTVVLTALFTAIFSTISVIDDRHHGFLQAVLVAPVSRTALVLGKTLGGVTIALLQAAALLALSPMAGFSLAEMNWPLLAGALTLAAIGFTALGFAMAWWIDSSQGYHAIMMVALIPLWMLSGAMFPASGGGAVMRGLMTANPMSYTVSAVRRGFYGDTLPAGLLPAGDSAAVEMLVITAFALLSIVAAVLLCRRRA